MARPLFGILDPVNSLFRSVVFFGLLLAAGRSHGAVEPEVDSRELPRVAPTEPRDALGTFQVKKGFKLQLVAAEPLVASPVAMSFDENGRLFVVEMIDYSERRDEVPHLGRIRMLEDTHGDGVFDRSTIFATNLAWPTAVFCANGGVFVGATPDVLFLQDTHGDGRADRREVVFSGFGTDGDRLNVQGMLNSFIWGLDNRIHGATSTMGGKVRQLKHPEAGVLDLHGRDFSFDPRTLAMTGEAGGGQHGLSFDNGGRRFACNNSDHIRLFVFDDREVTANPYFQMPPPLISIAADGPAAEVYRISPEEPWRVLRTQWRVSGKVPGPIEGGGRASGYFTGATGTLIYRGDAFPADYLENAFVGDAGGNLVHRKKLFPSGVGLTARRPDDEQKVEFIASRDVWFRPVQFANAPDGCLYIADMYREVIEHPWSLPQNIKKHLDLNSGNDRGRIYRVVPENFKQPKPVRLGAASTAELVQTLGHANGWHRDTAQRLLLERRAEGTAPLVEKFFRQSRSPLGRLHALHLLEALGGLSVEVVSRALGDADERVREQAVRLAVAPELSKKRLSLARDPSTRVRFQLALSLGGKSGPEVIRARAELVRRDPEEIYLKAAVLNSDPGGAAALFTALAGEAGTAGDDFLQQLARVIGGRKNQAEARIVLEEARGSGPRSFALVRGLGEGLQGAKSSFGQMGLDVSAILARATRVAGDAKAAGAGRVEAVQLLGLTSFAEAGQALLALLQLNQSQELQLAALGALDRFSDPRVGGELVHRLGTFTPRVRSAALNILLKRPERARALLEATASGEFAAASLSPQQIRFLKTHRDEGVRGLAAKNLPDGAATPRQKLIDDFQGALALSGEAAAGRKIYQERCASCHRLEGQGFALGPDLVSVRNSGKEKLLVNILDPNREVAANFVAYLVETADGESYLGLVANETAGAVTVRQAFGKENVLPRAMVRKIQSQNQSLMPEGLEAGLSAQDLANLLEFISTAKP